MTAVQRASWAGLTARPSGFASRFGGGDICGGAPIESVEAAQSEEDLGHVRLLELIASLAAVRPLPADRLAPLLATALRSLLQHGFESWVDPGAELDAACDRLAGAFDQGTWASALHLHPDDIPLATSETLPLVGDPAVERGHVRVATEGGWLEDGPAPRLRQLLALLEVGDA